LVSLLGAGQHYDMIEELRIAGLMSKVMSQHVDLLNTRELFEVATVRGANAIKRPDLGRLAINTKADIVLVDLKHPSITPVRDPLKNLIYNANSCAISDVYVDGRQVVQDGVVLTIDNEELSIRLQEVQDRVLSTVADRDWAKRSADVVSPFSLPIANQ